MIGLQKLEGLSLLVQLQAEIARVAVGFSSDGKRIAWGNAFAYSSNNERGPLEFTMVLPSRGEIVSEPQPLNSPEGFVRAPGSVASPDGVLSLKHRKGGPYEEVDGILDLLKDGTPIASIVSGREEGYKNVAYSLSPDGKLIVSAGYFGSLTGYNLLGGKEGAFVGHDGNVWGLAPSPDGTYLISGGNDQTVRLWNLKTRELLVTFFRSSEDEWVMWTPQGYYTGSPGADKIVGWHINKGPENAADYITAEQLRKHLNRPDIVAKAIQLASATEAVRTSYGTTFKLADLLARPAPNLRIVSPTADSSVNGVGSVTVKVALDATPDPVTRVRIQVNGRQLDDFLPQNAPKFEPGEHGFQVPVTKGKNVIVVTAHNEIGWSKSRDGMLTLTSDSAGELDRRGTLYIIAIGVTKYPGIPNQCYPNTTCDLVYTGADAKAFADVMQERLGALHARVERRLLVNGGKGEDAPTANNIVDALGILADTQPNDTVAVFLAGHGMNDGPDYRFLPTDTAMVRGAIRPSSVVPWYAIEDAIDRAKGRRLLFIDTCHSSGAYNERLGNAAYYANILAYSSARWDQVAWESPEFGHGLFTQAIVEVLEGKADVNKEGQVDTVRLNAYLRARVGVLAKALGQEQDPQFFKGRDAETYTLAVLH